MSEIKPQNVSKLESVFGCNAMKLLPPYSEIPNEFKQWDGTPWNTFVSELFFKGGSLAHLKEKPGIDRKAAITHIATILRSFEPKHEHKEAGCAYLFSLWFEPLEDNQ